MSLYEECYEKSNGDHESIMWCIADYAEKASAKNQEDLRVWLLVLSGAFVFFMQGGFAMVCAGAVREKNVNNTLLKNLLDAMGTAVAFAATGYAFEYGDGNGFIGTSNFFLMDVDSAVFFFQYGCCAAAVTIVAGSLAERCHMIGYLSYSLFLAGFVYPVVAHIIWSKDGFFSQYNEDAALGNGVVDFAGSGVVHVTGGSIALYATVILGPRRGRFFDSQGKPKANPGLTKGSSIALQALGTFILWFGWFGFNAGSSLIRSTENSGQVAVVAATNTVLAAAAGGISALFTKAKVDEKKSGEFNLNIVYAMNGTLSGLVAVTASCAVVDHWAAFVIGLIAGELYLLASYLLIKYKIDDAIDAIPVHLASGSFGLLAAGVFASPDKLKAAYPNADHAGLLYGGIDLIGAQIVGLLFIFAWTFATMYPFLKALDYKGLLRVNELEEIVGLDATYENEKMNDDTSETDTEVRQEAYKKRYEEKQEEKKKRKLRAFHDMPWGNLDIDPSSSSKSRSSTQEGLNSIHKDHGSSTAQKNDGQGKDMISSVENHEKSKEKS